jgi:hypothetical protein
MCLRLYRANFYQCIKIPILRLILYLPVFFRIVYGELYMNADYRYRLQELMGRAAALHTLWRLLSSPSSLAAALPGRRWRAATLLSRLVYAWRLTSPPCRVWTSYARILDRYCFLIIQIRFFVFLCAEKISCRRIIIVCSLTIFFMWLRFF